MVAVGSCTPHLISHGPATDPSCGHLPDPIDRLRSRPEKLNGLRSHTMPRQSSKSNFSLHLEMSYENAMSSSLSAVRPNGHTRRTRIVCVGDTHNRAVKLPEGDVLIHAGDLTNQGSYSEVSSIAHIK